MVDDIGLGVDVTRDIKLEGAVNAVSCGVDIVMRILDIAGIWIVSSGSVSNDTMSFEPKSPDPSVVMETIDVLLNTLFGAIIVEGVFVILVGGFVSFLKEEKVYIG